MWLKIRHQMSLILAHTRHYGKLYKSTIANKFILFLIMSQGRTLYVGSSHLVPLEMVNDPPGMGQRGRPGAVAVSTSVICRLDRWTCFIDDMKSHIGRQRISIQRHAISHERGSHLTPWEMCASWWLSDKWLFSLEKSGYMETDMQIRWWVRAV